MEKPDFPTTPDIPPLDWKYTPYGNPSEQLPLNAPKPLGKSVQLTTFYDANLMHDMLTGRSVTGFLHFWNKTPMDWYSKKQKTTETATYGSEFLACRTAFEHLVADRNYLRYLGVPIKNVLYVFGDNESQIGSCIVPESKLNKRYNILSYHFV